MQPLFFKGLYRSTCNGTPAELKSTVADIVVAIEDSGRNAVVPC